MGIDVTHFTVAPLPPTEDGERLFRIEAVAVDSQTGRRLLDCRGDAALVWPGCVNLLPHAAQKPFAGALAHALVNALATDARRGQYQVGVTPAGDPSRPDTTPFAPALAAADRHALYGVLLRVSHALGDAGLAFFLSGGGLLGQVRFGEMLPWDDDLDLTVVGGADPVDLRRRLPDLVVEEGVDRLTVRTAAGGPAVDLHAARIDGNELCRPGRVGWPDAATPLPLCLPVSRGRFGPLEVNLPADPAAWAVHTFGPHCLASAVPPERPDPAGGDPPPRVRVPLADLHARPAPPRTYEWVSNADLVADTVRLAGELPSDITAVAAVPRSGVLPASLIATQLHLPLYELTHAGRLNPLGHGGRMRGHKPDATGGRILVVDDAVYDGNAMTRARASMAKLDRPAAFAAVYTTARAEHVVDHFARHLENPQLMEWNLLNNGCVIGRGAPEFGAGIGCDLDGVLCHDDLSGGRPGTPYLVTRAHPCPLIATGRPERARAATEGWLRQWGVKWGELVMLADGEMLTADTAARHKADHYGRSRLGFFIESCPRQAALIHRWTGRPVVCPRVGTVFAKTRPGPDRLPALRHTPRCAYPVQDHTKSLLINSVDGLLDLLAHVGPVRRMAEVGCYRGVSSEVFAIHAAELVCVDHWDWSGDYAAKVEPEFLAMAAEYPNLRVLRRPSPGAADAVPDESMDLVYIDADHEHDSVAADIAAWWPKVRPGGWIAGHDYTPLVAGGGVVSAVAAAFGQPERVFSDTSWAVRKR